MYLQIYAIFSQHDNKTHMKISNLKFVYIIYTLYLCKKNNYASTMATELNIKRKNIDLPVDTLQKLSIMAVAQGKSLKKYIESILISKANNITIDVTENPSPSNDDWFDDPKNMEEVKEGIRQMKAGMGRAYTMDEIRNLLGL